MNRLKKILRGIEEASNREQRDELVYEFSIQLPEQKTYIHLLLNEIYLLIKHSKWENRRAGRQIFLELKKYLQIELPLFDFSVKNDEKKFYSSVIEEEVNLNFKQQRREIEKTLQMKKNIEKAEFIKKSDLKVKQEALLSRMKSTKKQKVKKKTISSFIEFFTVIHNDMFSEEWNERHGAFLIWSCLIERQEVENPIFQLNLPKNLLSCALSILKFDRFNDFQEDITYSPVVEVAALLISNILETGQLVDETVIFLFSLLSKENEWPVILAGLIALLKIHRFILPEKIPDLLSQLKILINFKDGDIRLKTVELLIIFKEFIEEYDLFTAVIIEELERGVEDDLAVLSYFKLLNLFEYKQLSCEIYKKYIRLNNSLVKSEILLLIGKCEMTDTLYNLLTYMLLVEENSEYRKDISNFLLKHRFIQQANKFIYNAPLLCDETVKWNSTDKLYFNASSYIIIKENLIENIFAYFDYFIMRLRTELIFECINFFEFHKKHSFLVYYYFAYLKSIIFAEDYSGNIRDIYENEEEQFTLLNGNLTAPEDFFGPIVDFNRNSINLIKKEEYLNYRRSLFIFMIYTDNMTTILDYLEYENSCTVASKLLDLLLLKNKIDEREIVSFILRNENIEINTLLIRKTEQFFTKQFLEEQSIEFFEKCLFGFSVNLDFLFKIEIVKRNIVFAKYFIRKYNFQLINMLIDILETDYRYVDNLKEILEEGNSVYNILLIRPVLLIISSRGYYDAFKIFAFLLFSLNSNLSILKNEEEYERLSEERKLFDGLFNLKNNRLDLRVRTKNIELREYQVEAVRWLTHLNKFNLNSILADDMGLGKTIMILSFLSQFDKKKIFIVSPASLVEHWRTEIDRYTTLQYEVYSKKNSTVSKEEEEKIILFSFENFKNRKIFLDEPVDFLIVDEAHIARNRDTKIYKALERQVAKSKIFLTGTPVQNSKDDLLSLFNILLPNFLSDCKSIREIHERTVPFILRRLKQEVLKDLPNKIISDILLTMDSEQAVLYEQYEQNRNTLKNRNQLLKICSHPKLLKEEGESPKLKALDDLFTEIKEKMLIFCQFRESIKLVANHLKGKKNYLILNSEVKAGERNRIAVDFNENPQIDILILSTNVGGHGLNLTGASVVIFFEHDWNPFNDLQAMDRAHRIGQKRTVNIYRFIMKDTIEQRVMALQRFKENIAKQLVEQQGNKDIMKMNLEDLMDRFKKDNEEESESEKNEDID